MPEKKATRKKTTKKATRKVVRKVVRKRAVKRTSARKAPTPIAETAEQAKKRTQILMVGAGILTLVFIASAIIGFTDKGRIEVSATIAERKAKATPEELVELESLNAEPSKKVQRGGLVPSSRNSEPSPAPNPAPETASSTATSTVDTASSTDEFATEVAETVNDAEINETASSSSGSVEE